MEKIMIAAGKEYLWKIGVTHIIEKSRNLSIFTEVMYGEEIIYQSHLHQVNLLILDQTLPDMSTMEILEALRKKGICFPILLVTNSCDIEGDILASFRLGVKGVLVHDSTESQLLDALYNVVKNREWCSPEFSYQLMTVDKKESDTELNHITQRELEVLKLMVEGYNNLEISELLNLSVYTIQNHISNIYSKLGIHERLKVVHYAIQKGIVCI